MKQLIAVLLVTLSPFALANAPVDHHTVTAEDCQRSDAIVQAAISVRDRVDYQTVAESLNSDQYAGIEGFRAMLPLTTEYVARVYRRELSDPTTFISVCKAKIGQTI